MQKKVSTRRQASANASAESRPSAIPRRVTRSKVAPPTTTRETRSMRALAQRSPPHEVKAHHNNKENFPLGPRPSLGARLLRGSPPRLNNKGIEKRPFSKSEKRRRVPLRELTEHEIFVRDEAVIGDLRRRRVSGDNVDGPVDVVEVETTLARPSPSNLAPRSMHSDISQESPGSNVPTITVPDEEVPFIQPQRIEKIQVLRRSDSEEQLKTKLETMAASNASNTIASRALRKRTALQAKKTHPAVRKPISSPNALNASFSENSIVHSVEASPVILRTKRSVKAASPRSSTKEYAGVTKVQASPSPLKPKRVGLGIKSANTAVVMRKVLSEANTNRKVVLNTSDKASNTMKPFSLASKKKIVPNNTTTIGKGKSSLKRAASVMGASGAKAGLAGIGRIR